MEPVDPRFEGMLGDGAGGPDELRAIVAKAGRRMRVRSAALAGAVALVAGGGVGYAVSSTGGSDKQVVATSPLSGGSASAPSFGSGEMAGVPAYALPASFKLTHLFTRQANGVDIRGYLASSYPPLTAPSAGVPGCGALSRFQAEVSTPAMVAVAGNGFIEQQLGSMLLTVQSSIVGVAEGDPVAVVVVQSNPSVAKIRMDFNGGPRDEMAPVQGWSAVAAAFPAYDNASNGNVTVGTLTAFDSSGRTLLSSPLHRSEPQPQPMPLGGVAGGSGTATSGTANSGTANSGTANSGTANSGTANSGSAGAGKTTYACPAPLPLPAPVLPLTCTPPTTVRGEVYACATPIVAPPAVLPAEPVTPATSTTTRSGSGG